MNQDRLNELADQVDTIGSWFHNSTRTKMCHEIAEELRGNVAHEPRAPEEGETRRTL